MAGYSSAASPRGKCAVKDLAGIDGPVPDKVDQFGQEPANPGFLPRPLTGRPPAERDRPGHRLHRRRRRLHELPGARSGFLAETNDDGSPTHRGGAVVVSAARPSSVIQEEGCSRLGAEAGGRRIGPAGAANPADDGVARRVDTGNETPIMGVSRLRFTPKFLHIPSVSVGMTRRASSATRCSCSSLAPSRA